MKYFHNEMNKLNFKLYVPSVPSTLRNQIKYISVGAEERLAAGVIWSHALSVLELGMEALCCNFN